jgi:hypothetical protein
MDIQAAVRDQIALLNDGKPLEAFDRYFDDDGEIFDNDRPFAKGNSRAWLGQARKASLSRTASFGRLRRESVWRTRGRQTCRVAARREGVAD